MKTEIIQEAGNLTDLKALAEECLDNYTLPLEKAESKSKNKDFVLLFAEKDSQKLGFISGYAEKESFHIWLLGVKKEARGQGVGSALISAFEELASKKGYKSITTITFNKYPEKIGLSLKLGFKITGKKFIEEKDDEAIFFRKELGD